MGSMKTNPPRINALGGLTIYGLESSVSMECPNCKRLVALGWEDGEVYYLSYSWDFPDVKCINCRSIISEELISEWRRRINKMPSV